MDDALISEALRLYRRYRDEIVERYKLCPWAERARQLGHVTERVLLVESAEPRCALEAVDELEAVARVEVALLLFPRLSVGRIEFDRFVAECVRADSARRDGQAAPFAFAAFHPDAAADTSDGERLIPFLRRTPDPTIQLVRMSALERVRRGQPEGTQFVDIRLLSSQRESAEHFLSLRERIARDNLRAVSRAGIETVEAAFEDIRRDRELTYARLGLSSAPSCPSN